MGNLLCIDGFIRIAGWRAEADLLPESFVRRLLRIAQSYCKKAIVKLPLHGLDVQICKKWSAVLTHA
jgi:hypothetical protein